MSIMTSLMQNPYAGQYLGQMGLGLLGAAQPQPPGVNRYSLLMNAFNQANQGLMQRRLFDMQMKEAQEKKAEEAARRQAQSQLFGGLDPATGITWEQGRPMTPEQTQSTMFRAYPEQMGGALARQMFQQPAAPKIIKDAEGYQRYATGPQAGERVFPGVAKREEPKPVSAITLEHPEHGTITLSRTDPRLSEYLQPGSGWTETRRERRGDILSPARRDEIAANMQALDRGLAKAKQQIANIKRDPSIAGAIGSTRSAMQTISGILGDVGGWALRRVGMDNTAGKVDEAVAEIMYDPRIIGVQKAENDLAYALARARKGEGRLTVQDFENARRDVKLTGFTSADAAITRLELIMDEITQARSGLQRRVEPPKETPTTILNYNPETGEFE